MRLNSHHLCAAAGGSDADYSGFTGHELHVVPTSETLTFEHSYTWWGNARKLRVAAQPNVTLTAAHVPRQCRGARTVLLGPLMPQDMDCASFIQPTGELHFFQAGRILDNPWDPLTVAGMRPA